MVNSSFILQVKSLSHGLGRCYCILSCDLFVLVCADILFRSWSNSPPHWHFHMGQHFPSRNSNQTNSMDIPTVSTFNVQHSTLINVDQRSSANHHSWHRCLPPPSIATTTLSTPIHMLLATTATATSCNKRAQMMSDVVWAPGKFFSFHLIFFLSTNNFFIFIF